MRNSDQQACVRAWAYLQILSAMADFFCQAIFMTGKSQSRMGIVFPVIYNSYGLAVIITSDRRSPRTGSV